MATVINGSDNFNTNNVATDTELAAVVATGTNANGSYIKYDNGVLVCTGETSDITTGAAWTSFYFNDGSTGTFPHAFIDTDITITASGLTTAGVTIVAYIVPTSTTTCSARIVGGRNTDVGRAQYTAVGRWK